MTGTGSRAMVDESKGAKGNLALNSVGSDEGTLSGA